MSKTRPKPAAKEAPKTEPKYIWESRTLAARLRDQMKLRLIDMLDEFATNANAAETQFMIGVLEDRDSRGSTGEYEIPLLSAIESANRGDIQILKAPSEEIARLAGDYMESLEKRAEQSETLEKEPSSSGDQLREMRLSDIAHYLRCFQKNACADDVFFLYEILVRWNDFLEYEEKFRPPSPLLAAIGYEMHRQRHLLISVPARFSDEAKAVMSLVGNKTWLGSLLLWIAQQGIENLSPCLVASKAAAMQDAFNAAQKNAA